MKAPNEKFRAYLFQSLCSRERGGGGGSSAWLFFSSCAPCPLLIGNFSLSVSPSFFSTIKFFPIFSGFSKREFNPCCGRYYGESGLFVPGGVNPRNPFSNRLSC